MRKNWRSGGSSGLSTSVTLTGYCADVSRFFEAADVIVHSSIDADPFPRFFWKPHGKARNRVGSGTGRRSSCMV
jgi:hypothetical protein